MVSDNQPISPRRPGRPPIPVPEGRDLDAELKQIAAFFEAHPAIRPGTISRGAGLHAQALGAFLRGERRAKASDIDAVNEALKPYR